ncbi:phosphoglucomutase, partial [Staphylococcus chromogenes]|nr:phosphoglucomutase [Staphylococcus chromogenes]
KAAFQYTLKFGTAGIRSTFGLGPGRLNKITIRKVALGLARYLKAEHAHPTVVIHFDTRFLSQEFAYEIASVLATNEVKAIVSESYKSTPELSFAVRYLKADAGVMITASHNPKDYNGIKVYGEDGAQLSTEPSNVLSDYINALGDPLTIELPQLSNEQQSLILSV